MAHEYFSTTKNGRKIYYDPINSHASTHFEDTPNLKELVNEIIPKTIVVGEGMVIETNLGKVVGKSDLVETDEDDDIVYAIRKNRQTYARFSKSKRPAPSSVVTIVIKQIELEGKKVYELYSAWIGPNTPSFPGDEKETPESRPFWNKHALAWGAQEVDKSTVTNNCPW